MMHFINNLRNRAAFIKGDIFANDQYRDEQLQIEIALNSKYDGLNKTKDIEFLEYQAFYKDEKPKCAKFQTIEGENDPYWDCVPTERCNKTESGFKTTCGIPCKGYMLDEGDSCTGD